MIPYRHYIDLMIFWTAVAGAAIIVILLVLRPLLRGASEAQGEHTPEVDIYKDQLAEVEQDIARGVISEADAEAAKTEIARRLLAAAEAQDAADTKIASAGTVGAAVIGVSALAISLAAYSYTGSPHLPDQPKSERVAQAQANPDLSNLVTQVEEQLQKTPNDARGWAVLGPAYMRLRRFGDAADAFRKAAALSPKDADLQTSLGEALTMSEAGLVSADAHAAFNAALSINPNHAKARFYLGIAAFQDGRKKEAITRWKELLADAPANAPWRKTVLSHIERAGGDAGQTAESIEARPPALDKETMASAEQMSEADQQEMIKGMVNRLAERLQENGKDLEGWLRLMRARSVLGQKDQAAKALADARANFKDDTASLERLKTFAAQLGLETN
ncbi:MAG: c-type cytochrome biogenesis protein CcmI [Rhizobiales bacterium]|nr:c-type cytochrome biogenesis protein CcmI [Hyphomicrobiales bacterium]